MKFWFDQQHSVASGVFGVGVYVASDTDVFGTLIDTDIIAQSQNLFSDKLGTETYLKAATTPDPKVFGDPLWQVASVVTGTWTEDPDLELELVFLYQNQVLNSLSRISVVVETLF